MRKAALLVSAHLALSASAGDAVAAGHEAGFQIGGRWGALAPPVTAVPETAGALPPPVVERGGTAGDLRPARPGMMRYGLPPVTGDRRTSVWIGSGAPPGIDALSIFGGSETSVAGDVYHLGGEASRGPATAGVGVALAEGDPANATSRIYLDLAVSETVTLGVSGLLASEVDGISGRVGVGAAWTGDNGSFLSGGVSATEEVDAVFDMSVGLRF